MAGSMWFAFSSEIYLGATDGWHRVLVVVSTSTSAAAVLDEDMLLQLERLDNMKWSARHLREDICSKE